jgi:hypothetical protein
MNDSGSFYRRGRPWFRTGQVFCFFLLACAAHATDCWQDALARMPLEKDVSHLSHTNCIRAMLDAFRSNQVVKALIFMPGATDEFYMFKRAHADLTNSAPSLLDALVALTNQTVIRATFQPPLLLLHTAEDPLEPVMVIEHAPTAEKLRQARFLPYLLTNDRDWDFLQPKLRWGLKIDVRPWSRSQDSWHFYRHSFAAWDLNGLEALQTAALAGKSRLVVRRKQVEFEADSRIGATPKLESFPQ